MTNFQLKLLAVIIMLVDHIGIILQPMYNEAILLRIIGRAAFPLFVFLIAQACIHTKNIKLFLLRLGGFAIVSQVPFVMLGGFGLFESFNIFVTLFLGVLMIYLYKLAIARDPMYLIAFMALFIFAFLLAEMLNIDYGGMGVMYIVMMYIAHKSNAKKKATVLLTLAIMMVLYPPTLDMGILFTFGSLSTIAMMRYNGRVGYKGAKWLFYAFYPAHMLMLVAISEFIF